MPEVSVVMPAHNGAAFISKAIASVLDQTFHDLELIVVDDGSTDRTEAVVRSFADARVRYIYQTNSGPAAARNRGIQHSTGTWLAFLDSDDYWLPRKLEAQMSVARLRPNAGMIYCAAELRSVDGELIRPLPATVEGRPLDQLLVGNCIAGSASAAMLRRDVLDSIGYFDERVSGSEDWELWMRAASATDIAKVDEVLACVVFRPGSLAKQADRIRDVSIAALNLAFATYAADRRHLRRRALWHIHYNAAIAHQEQDSFRGARRELLKSIFYRPTFIRGYWRLLRALARRR